MCIYHFVMVLARFFSFHPHIPGMCLWEIWLGYCGFFFFFKSDFMEGGGTHKQITVWKMKVQTHGVPAALCHPWLSFHEGEGWQCPLAASRHVHPDTEQTKHHT